MTIVEANSWKHKKWFIDFPHDLYADDPNYVPEIFMAQKDLMNPTKNPFFKHSKVQLYLALKDGKPVGRVAAIRNNNHIAYTEKHQGFFGFFDVIDDYVVAKALLDKATEWVKEEGLKSVIGPANFTTNDTAGVLVKGFDRPPVAMMPYNKLYYIDFLERYGFEKQMDLLAYLATEEKVSRKSVKLASMIEERLKRKGITIRNVNMKRFKEEVMKIKEVYNAAWDKNWGFVPATDEEFEHLANDFKMIVNPAYTLVAEHEGKIVAFAIAIPDINEIMINVKRGRLFPFGILKLLWGKNRVKRIRIITLGVLEEYRKMGIEGVFYANIIQAGLARGVKEAEASWILEDNEMMNKGLININAEPYKRYRMYQKKLMS